MEARAGQEAPGRFVAVATLALVVLAACGTERPPPAARPDPHAQTAAPRAAAPVSAAPDPPPPPALEAGDESPIGRRLSAAVPAGARPRAEMTIGLLSGGAVQDVWVPAAAGACLVVVAVSDEPARAIDLDASDDRGRRVARADPDGPVAVLRACPDRAGTLRVRVHLDGGIGRFALQVFDP